ncbi:MULTISPECIES: LemA family protein [Synergistaceae]|jgi:LemA protein|uniref:LemA family protein n=1 Tax=Synergistaceae TaxID=649777 RepID=UPI0026863537|nr:LemA family protein [Synergistaceae bacterium DZ-S4]
MMMFLLAAAAVLGLWLMTTYNGLVKLRNLMQEGWSGIDVQLKRRSDLIPNLVETVKGYASHEKETLQGVTNARAAVMQAGNDPEARLKAENALTGTLRSLFAVAENYPELKANTNFLDLQQQLGTIENEIQMSRRYYNGTARNLNTAIQRFPAVLIARQFGFKEAPFFEAEEEARENPKVSF